MTKFDTAPDLPAGFSHLTITSGIRAAAMRAPGKVALRFEGRSITYGRFIERLNRIVNLVRDGFGLAVGDHAMLIAHNSIEFLELICGLPDAGLVVATPNPRLSEREIALIVADSDPKLIFVDAASEKLLAAADLAGRHVVVIGREYEDLLARSSDRDRRVPVAEWTPFSIPYTSGTTGMPKGVLLPHRSRTMTFFAMASEYGCYGPDDHFLAIAPFCHGAGLAFALGSLFFGGTCTIMGKFDPEETIRLLNTGEITGTFMVPTHFHKIFELPADVLARNRGGHRLRSIISNAAPLPQATKVKIIDHWGEGLLHETYGATESGIVTNLRPQDQLRKQHCVGTPFPCTEIELRDENGNPVPTGEVGELFSRSPYLFNGYLNRDDETREVIRDGWVSVGDMARKDEEGYYYIVDRKKDMVIAGGLNIYPREVENVIGQVPGVAEVSVVGKPDPQWGESLVAFVVADPARPAPTADDVIAACKRDLAGYKVPRAVHFIPELPRNAGGKILKRELRDLAVRIEGGAD